MKKMIFLMTIFMIMACSKNEQSVQTNQEVSKEPIGKELLSIGDLTVTPDASNPSSVTSKNATLIYNVKNNSINSGFFTLNTLGFNFSSFSINYASSTCLGSVLKVLGPSDTCSIVVNFYTETSSGTYNSSLTLVDGKSQISLIQFPISINYVDSSTGTGSTPITGGCKVGYHLVGRRCVINPQTRACLAQPAHSVNGVETSTDGGNNWGACLGYTCQMNYLMDESNNCQPEACTISNYYMLSDILQDSNITGVSGSYPNCTVTTCGSGYNVSTVDNKCMSASGTSFSKLFISKFSDFMFAEKNNMDLFGFAQGTDANKLYTPSIPYNQQFYMRGNAWTGMKSFATDGRWGCFIGGDDLIYCWGNGPIGSNMAPGFASNAPVAIDRTGDLAGKTFKSVYVVTDKACAIASDNLVYCWGQNMSGSLGGGVSAPYEYNQFIVGSTQTPQLIKMTGVLAGKTIKKMALGRMNGCVVASDDKAYCWGENSTGQLGNGTTSAVMPSSSEPVLVDTTSVFLNGETVVDIAVGSYSSCLLNSANRVFCWGTNDYGSLGVGSGSTSLIYTKPTTMISGSLLINQISFTQSTACGITTNKKAYCWGYGASGEMGNNTITTNNTNPVEVTGLAQLANNFKKIFAGGSICATNSFDALFCWGYNGYAQIGTGSKTPTSIRVPTSTGMSGITLAYAGETTCSLDSNSLLYCWGGVGATSGTNVLLHSLQDGTISSPYPKLISELQPNQLNGKRALKVVTNHSLYQLICVLADDNEIYCRGNSNLYLLGISNVPYYANVPYVTGEFHQVERSQMGSVKFKDVFIDGGTHVCGIGTDDKAYCWGSNYYGQLGLGDNMASVSYYSSPVVTDGYLANKSISKISMTGQSATCLLTTDKQLYCMGSNSWGQMGNPIIYPSTNVKVKSGVPLPIHMSGALNGLTINDVESNEYSFTVLASNQKLYFWGNMYGEAAYIYEPTVVGSLNSSYLTKNIKKISGGKYHTCALSTDNLVYCWGYNYYGQVGNGTVADVSWKNPALINGSGVLSGKNLKDIKVGLNFSCAIDIDDKYYCWGQNSINLKINSLVPVEATFFNQ